MGGPFKALERIAHLFPLWVVGGTVACAACTLDKSGMEIALPDADTGDATTPDGDVAADSAADVQEGGVDASCAGVICNGACLQADDCRSCAGASLLCGSSHTCTADCGGCVDSLKTAMPIQCFSCDQSHQNPLGTCEYDDSNKYCLSGDYSSSYVGQGIGLHCGCDDAGVGACPGATQVCAPTPNGASVCVTCGEPFTTDLTGFTCKGGHTCNSAQHTCL
jgi:hypothetical protein